MSEELLPYYLYAWMGMDEMGSGEVGIKQGVVPAGHIPIVSIDKDKIHRLKSQFEEQAAVYGEKIYLVRYRLDAVEDATNEGRDL